MLASHSDTFKELRLAVQAGDLRDVVKLLEIPSNSYRFKKDEYIKLIEIAHGLCAPNPAGQYPEGPREKIYKLLVGRLPFELRKEYSKDKTALEYKNADKVSPQLTPEEVEEAIRVMEKEEMGGHYL